MRGGRGEMGRAATGAQGQGQTPQGWLFLWRHMAARGCAGERWRRLMVALPPPSLFYCRALGLGLGLGDVAGLGGTIGDVPRGSSSVCPLVGGRLHEVPRGAKAFVVGWTVAWLGHL